MGGPGVETEVCARLSSCVCSAFPPCCFYSLYPPKYLALCMCFRSIYATRVACCVERAASSERRRVTFSFSLSLYLHTYAAIPGPHATFARMSSSNRDSPGISPGGDDATRGPSPSPVPSTSLPIPQIPPHPAHAAAAGTSSGPYGSSPRGAASPRLASSPLPPNATDSPSGGSAAPLTDAQKADVIRRHLLNAEEQQRVARDQQQQQLQASSPSSPSSPRGGRAAFPQAATATEEHHHGIPTTTTAVDEEYPTPYHLQGGDVVAGVYKWVAQQQQQQEGNDSGISSTPLVGPNAANANSSGIALPGANGGGGGGVGAALRRSKSAASLQPSVGGGPGGGGGGGGSRRTSLAGGGGGGGDAARAAARLALGAGADAASETAAAAAAAADESAISIDNPAAAGDDDGLTTTEMLQPGGFRRDFVLRKQQQALAASSGGETAPSPSNGGRGGGAGSENASLFSQPAGGESGSFVHLPAPTTTTRPAMYGRPTRSFIDFLTLYGHFGGEDLEEIEEEEEEEEEEMEEEMEEEEDEEAAVGVPGRQQKRSGAGVPGVPGPLASLRRAASERTPLLRTRSSVRSTRSMSRKRGVVGGEEQGGPGVEGEAGAVAAPEGMKEHGDATVTQAVMMLLKSFVGTGVLFLGKACVSFSQSLSLLFFPFA